MNGGIWEGMLQILLNGELQVGIVHQQCSKIDQFPEQRLRRKEPPSKMAASGLDGQSVGCRGQTKELLTLSLLGGREGDFWCPLVQIRSIQSFFGISKAA